ncbi:MAG TPA: choice-of-anchor V domain-containing protein, partial [Bacteroidota bacterium]
MVKIRFKPFAVALASCVMIVSVYYLAYSFSTGKTGQTLKSSPTAGCGAKTTGGGSCHGTSANTAVTATIGGSHILGAGKTGAYTLSLSGSTGVGGGFDIAVGSGTLSASADSIQLQSGELTHTRPLGTPYLIKFSLTAAGAGLDTIFANGKGVPGWNWAPNFIIRVGPPPAPVLDSPPTNSVGLPLTPKLVWSGIVGPRWTVEAATDSTFASPVLHQVVVGETTYTVKAGILQNDVVYYWHVSATDTGGTSPYSL